MLVVYLKNLSGEQQQFLQQHRVRYWPRTWSPSMSTEYGTPEDWWIDFDQDSLLTEWMLRYTEDSRIMRTLFD